MEVFSLGLLLSDDFDAVQAAQLGDVVKHLAAVVLLVLNWVEREVELREEVELLDVLKLKNLHDVVEGKVQEAEGFDVMEPGEEADVVL